MKLAPGEYTLETAVQDGRGGKLTARRTPFKVQAPQGLAMSSLSLGDLLPAGSGAAIPTIPCVVGNQRLIPNLGQPIKAGQPAMTLYSVVYPVGRLEGAGRRSRSRSCSGTSRSTTPPRSCPRPMPPGRSPTPRPCKMDVLPPGNYRFNVAVTQGSSRAEESVSFTIVP